MKKNIAIVYCEGAFNTPNGKTANGLVRFTNRYKISSVVDSCYAGKDAGEVLDGKPKRIPICVSLAQALKFSKNVSHLVIGLTANNGYLNKSTKEDIKQAIKLGLHIDSGLSSFLSEDPEFSKLAKHHKVKLCDIRKPLPKDSLHFFCGKIKEVKALKIVVLGTDSAVGKRTTAWLLVQTLEKLGIATQMIGTGQTSWMQGARYNIVVDSLINDFVSGEVEHIIHKAWQESKPNVIVIEGQKSLLHPINPEGYKILAGGRPDIVILQDAPARKEHNGFPGHIIADLSKQIDAVKLFSNNKPIAITINHEGLPLKHIPFVCQTISSVTGIPAFDVLKNGAEDLAKLVLNFKKVKMK